jgi:hypothetical protein
MVGLGWSMAWLKIPGDGKEEKREGLVASWNAMNSLLEQEIHEGCWARKKRAESQALLRERNSQFRKLPLFSLQH